MDEDRKKALMDNFVSNVEMSIKYSLNSVRSVKE